MALRSSSLLEILRARGGCGVLMWHARGVQAATRGTHARDEDPVLPVREKMLAVVTAAAACALHLSAVPSCPRTVQRPTAILMQEGGDEPSLLDNIQTGFRIYRESSAAGADFKQALADALGTPRAQPAPCALYPS